MFELFLTGALGSYFLLQRDKQRKLKQIQTKSNLHRKRNQIERKKQEKIYIPRKDNKNDDENENESKNNKSELTDEKYKYIVKQNAHSLQDFRNNKRLHSIYEQNMEKDPIQTVIDVIIQKYLFKNKEEQYEFLELIIEMLNDAVSVFVKEYKLKDNDIKIIFHSRNLLRNLATEFLFTLPNKTSIHLHNYFNMYFKNNLLKWFIILNPNINNYEYIFTRLQYYLSLVLKDVCNYLSNYKEEIFEYFKLNKSYNSIILQEMGSNIEELFKEQNITVTNIKLIDSYHTYLFNSLDSINSINLINSNNSVILNRNPNDTSVINLKINEHKEKTYYYLNFKFYIDYLESSQSNNKIIDANFILFKLLHKNNPYVAKLLNNQSLSSYEYKYSLDESFKFTGISYSYICNRLEDLIYTDKPWELKKYKQYYSQFMYFSFIDLFIKLTNNRHRNSIITLIQNYLRALLEYNRYNQTQNSDEIKLINTMKRKLLNKLSSKTYYKKFIQKIDEYEQNYHGNSKYKNFLILLLKNITIFNNVFNSIYTYCTKGNKISDETIYKGNIKNII